MAAEAVISMAAESVAPASSCRNQTQCFPPPLPHSLPPKFPTGASLCNLDVPTQAKVTQAKPTATWALRRATLRAACSRSLQIARFCRRPNRRRRHPRRVPDHAAAVFVKTDLVHVCLDVAHRMQERKSPTRPCRMRERQSPKSPTRHQTAIRRGIRYCRMRERQCRKHACYTIPVRQHQSPVPLVRQHASRDRQCICGIF